jgi:hypothetical protein
MTAVTGRLILDEHVASVVEFMERNLPVDRLEAVAARLPSLAKVLWGRERCASLEYLPISALQSSASESSPVGTCAGDDSAAA